jgi:hypothetical protein
MSDKEPICPTEAKVILSNEVGGERIRSIKFSASIRHDNPIENLQPESVINVQLHEYIFETVINKIHLNYNTPSEIEIDVIGTVTGIKHINESELEAAVRKAVD